MRGTWWFSFGARDRAGRDCGALLKRFESVMCIRAAGNEILTQPSQTRESLGLCGPGSSPETFVHGSIAQFEERSRVLCTQPVTYKSSEWFHKTQTFCLLVTALLGRYSHAPLDLLGKAGRIRSEV